MTSLSPLSPLTATVQVRTYELDSFGHVNNSVYLNYLEEARSEFLKQMGVSFHDFAQEGVQLVIVESYVKYVSAARYGDAITISGKIRGVSPVAAYIDYTLTETVSGRLIATAWTRGAFVNATTGKPTRAPKLFQEAFQTFAQP
jgi:acyl-CoA thioester hydrolase